MTGSQFVVAVLLCASAMGFTRDARADTDDDLVVKVRNALVHSHLAPQPQCLLYRVARNSNPGIDRVDVSAKHSPACGGDPSLDEHLFSVFIDQKTMQMGTDAADPAEGTLKILPPD